MLLVLALIGLFLLPEPWNVAVVVAAAFVEVGEVFFWLRFLRRYRIQTGAEAMVGARAEVLESCAPDGRVRVGGEIWNARSDVPVARGQLVRITAVDGLTLAVEPLAAGGVGAANPGGERPDRPGARGARREHGKGPGKGAPAP